jgi:hypothetical protein
VAAARGRETLVAWVEFNYDLPTVRASRIDAAGNYLDGQGIIIATVPRGGRVAVAAAGTNWAVVWSSDNIVRAAFISADGRVDPKPVVVGQGDQAAVGCAGERCLIVYEDRTLLSAVLVPGPRVTAPTTLAEWEPRPNGYTEFNSFGIASANGEWLTTFDHATVSFNPFFPGVGSETQLMALPLDGEGRPKRKPIIIPGAKSSAPLATTSDGRRYLVVWEDSFDLRAALLPADAPENGGFPFLIAKDAAAPVATFDGSRFLILWRRRSDAAIAIAPLTDYGAFPITWIPIGAGEPMYNAGVVAAAGETTIYLNTVLEAYDQADRAAILRLSDLGVALVPPAPPRGVEALRDGEAILVRWTPPAGALGVSIELRLIDGLYRAVEVAPGGATSARVSGTNLTAVGVRLRSWNAAGLSEPSADALIGSRLRAVR